MTVKADQHFAIIPEWVLYADVSDKAVRLYGSLRRYADKNGRAHPSRRKLAEDIHASTKSVDRALDELEGIGALTVTPRMVEGRQSSNDYEVHTSPRVDTGDQGGVDTHDEPPLDTGVPQNESQPEPEPVEPEKPLAPRRKRDFVFDALAEVCGVAVDKATKRERGGIAKAAAEIREATNVGDWAYEDVRSLVLSRAAQYRRRYPNAALTPNALAMHWGECEPPALAAYAQTWIAPPPLSPEEEAAADEARKREMAEYRKRRASA